MNFIPSLKSTKAELLKIIELKDNGLEKLRSDLEKQCGRTQDALMENRRHGERIEKLLEQLKNAYLTNLSDIKSISTYLSIYETESMTHREKSYLGKKLRHVIDLLIEERMQSMKFKKDITPEDEIPF